MPLGFPWQEDPYQNVHAAEMLAAKGLSTVKTSGTEMMTAEMTVVMCGRMRVNSDTEFLK